MFPKGLISAAFLFAPCAPEAASTDPGKILFSETVWVVSPEASDRPEYNAIQNIIGAWTVTPEAVAATAPKAVQDDAITKALEEGLDKDADSFLVAPNEAFLTKPAARDLLHALVSLGDLANVAWHFSTELSVGSDIQYRADGVLPDGMVWQTYRSVSRAQDVSGEFNCRIMYLAAVGDNGLGFAMTRATSSDWIEIVAAPTPPVGSEDDGKSGFVISVMVFRVKADDTASEVGAPSSDQ